MDDQLPSVIYWNVHSFSTGQFSKWQLWANWRSVPSLSRIAKGILFIWADYEKKIFFNHSSKYVCWEKMPLPPRSGCFSRPVAHSLWAGFRSTGAGGPLGKCPALLVLVPAHELRVIFIFQLRNKPCTWEGKPPLFFSSVVLAFLNSYFHVNFWIILSSSIFFLNPVCDLLGMALNS